MKTVAMATVALLAAHAPAQITYQPDTYLFATQMLQTTNHSIWQYDAQGNRIATLDLEFDELQVMAGLTFFNNRLFTSTSISDEIVEFDPVTGELLRRYDAQLGGQVIGLTNDGSNVLANGFQSATGVYSPDDGFLETYPKPVDFLFGGGIAASGSQIFYYEEQLDQVMVSNAAGDDLGRTDISVILFPDSLDYDPVTSDFLFSRPGFVSRYDQNGQFINEVAMSGFGISAHSGFHYMPIPSPSTSIAFGAIVIGSSRRRRKH